MSSPLKRLINSRISIDPKHFQAELLPEGITSVRCRIMFVEEQTVAWKILEPADEYRPLERCAHSSVLVGEKLYVVGGHVSTGCVNDVWILDIPRVQWSAVMLTGRRPESRCGNTTIMTSVISHIL